MWHLLRSALQIGVLSTAFVWGQSASAQKTRKDWLQPDIKYVDQRGFSLGVKLGMTDMWADVGTKTVLDHYLNANYWKDAPKVMGGIYGKYTHKPGIAFRLGVENGVVYANDNWNERAARLADYVTDDPVQRYYRNLDAKTNIWEASLMFELSPFQAFGNWEFGKMAHMRFQPYVMVGVGGIYFNPRGSYYTDFEKNIKQWVDLRPLHTEGQTFNKNGMPKSYDQFALMIPAGIGFRVDIGRGLALGMEYMLRYTFTDYLDDVSGKYIDPLYFDIAYLNEGDKAKQAKQMADRTFEIVPGAKHAAGEFRGDPSTKDMYSSISLNFYWRINKRALAWWK